MDRPEGIGAREGTRPLGARLRGLSYLGLQRRIMLYVALGLAVIFGGFYYLMPDGKTTHYDLGMKAPVVVTAE